MTVEEKLLRFRDDVYAPTEAFLEDYRRNPPPDRTPEQIEAYCEGFKEAAMMFAAVVAADRVLKLA